LHQLTPLRSFRFPGSPFYYQLRLLLVLLRLLAAGC
jgi:hypothetical protein